MKNIMTVDDSPSLRQMVCVVLRGADYQVIEAVDGVNALSKLNGQELHLFLVDVNMPNMGGLELTRKLRAMPQYKVIPIVLLTTESSTEKKQEGKAAGATSADGILNMAVYRIAAGRGLATGIVRMKDSMRILQRMLLNIAKKSRPMNARPPCRLRRRHWHQRRRNLPNTTCPNPFPTM